jgi:hypothetical protein
VYYPGQHEFVKLAAQGNLILVTRRILADLETPLSGASRFCVNRSKAASTSAATPSSAAIRAPSSSKPARASS